MGSAMGSRVLTCGPRSCLRPDFALSRYVEATARQAGSPPSFARSASLLRQGFGGPSAAGTRSFRGLLHGGDRDKKKETSSVHRDNRKVWGVVGAGHPPGEERREGALSKTCGNARPADPVAVRSPARWTEYSRGDGAKRSQLGSPEHQPKEPVRKSPQPPFDKGGRPWGGFARGKPRRSVKARSRVEGGREDSETRTWQ